MTLQTRRTWPWVVLVAALAATGCHERHWGRGPTAPGDLVVGSGNVVQEIRSVSAFEGVSLDGIGTVEVSPGSSEALIVEAEDNILPYLRTRVAGRDLVISKDPSVNLQPRRSIVFHVTVRSVDHIALIGAGNIRCSGLSGSRLTLSTIGVGDIDCSNLALQSLAVEVTGVGAIRTSGTVDTQEITLAGVGSYGGRDLQSATADVKLLSVGSATVRVSDLLIARVIGSGCVHYIGSPQLDTVVTGTGCISRID